MQTKHAKMDFRLPEPQAERIKRAAELEGLSVSEWLRRVALLRVAELGDRLDAAAATK